MTYPPMFAMGSGWDAADAWAAHTRISAIMETTACREVHVDDALGLKAMNVMNVPTGTNMTHRMDTTNGARIAAASVFGSDGTRVLTMALMDHPSISDMVLQMVMESAKSGNDVVHRSDDLTDRLETVRSAVARTHTLMDAGRRHDAAEHRARAVIAVKSAEAIIAARWLEQGALKGSLSMVITSTKCPTPWTPASMTTTQTIRPDSRSALTRAASLRKTEHPLLDEEGTAILEAALPNAIDVSWTTDSKTASGLTIRRLRISATSIGSVITPKSLLDPMETLRAHRLVPIPDRCIAAISA